MEGECTFKELDTDIFSCCYNCESISGLLKRSSPKPNIDLGKWDKVGQSGTKWCRVSTLDLALDGCVLTWLLTATPSRQEAEGELEGEAEGEGRARARARVMGRDE